MANNKVKTGSRLRKTPSGEQRYIKVHEAYYEYRTQTQAPNSGCRTVPMIQMKGHWLQQAGFSINRL